MTFTFRHTLFACYAGYICQAVVNNLAPLLFFIFGRDYGLSSEQLGRLVLLNFTVQIGSDVLALRYADRIGHRSALALAHFFCAGGLLMLGILPFVLPSAYAGLCIAAVFYAVGGGFLEVMVSPVVNSLPGEEKERAMSLLHSFYCWGQVAVVLLCTLFLWLSGGKFWPLLPFIWALLPLINMLLFLKVPLMPPLPEEHRTPLRSLLGSGGLTFFLLLMLFSGASELSMSQWSSYFAEGVLGLPKIVGDIFGPCLFAVFMGAARALYGLGKFRIDINSALTLSAAACLGCYIAAVFSPWPALSLAGCALCGFTVGLMWPGSFSLAAARFPLGGTALFGMLAVFGDIGAAFGPWFAGAVADISGGTAKLSFISDTGGHGLRLGLLAASVFPLGMIILLPNIRKAKK